MKKVVLLAFVLVLFSLVVADSNIETHASNSDVPDVPSWIRVGTYAEYLLTDLKNTSKTAVWKWEIVSVANQIEVLHTFEGLSVSEDYPSVFKSTINVTTRGITNVTAIDKELSPWDGPPLMTIFALWVPAGVEINDTILVVGPYGSSYPYAPVLRFENVDTPLETKECVVAGFEMEQGYPETDLFWYNLHTNVLVKFYMNWTAYNAEGMVILKQWVPVSEFNFTFGEETYNITTSSNSTIENFNFNQTLKQISFNVTGPTGTTGFCNITILDDLLSGEFSVYMDSILLEKDVDYTQIHNGTHYIFSITYTHSTHVIEIRGTEVIPEFATWTSMLLIPILLTVAIAIHKRRLLKISFR